jgi:adenine-specific DNA-methyltransferase
MDKLKMQTVNKADENFKKLAAMFPNAVTETIDENGEIVRAIDKDVLMQEISCKVVDGNEERYQFTWPDKKKSVLLANAPINKTLRPVRDDETTPTGVDSDGKPYCSSGSVDFDNTENLYIEGDNLEVLKLLQETYLGKIKMIYIDPPYNTGNDFVYADDFSQSTEEYLENSGQFDDEGNRLVKNLDNNGRFHTDWLNMLYPRLKLAKDLLAEDGVIFISIDDNEVENLKKMCNEVFGQINFVGMLSVENNPKGRKNSTFISVSSEYCLIFAKNKEISYFVENVPKKSSDMVLDENGRYVHNSGKRVLVGENSFNKIVTSPSSDKNYSVYFRKQDYSIITKKEEFGVIDKALIDAGYIRYASYNKGKLIENTYTEEKFLSLAEKKALDFSNDKIYEKNFSDTIRMKSQLVNREYEAIVRGSKKKFSMELTTTGAGTYLKELFGLFDVPFTAPKNTGFLKMLISLFEEKDFYVLDFFSGSASEADAVMRLNAVDGGKRKFIMVQVPEVLDEKSVAYKAGYKNICEIGKERIRRAAKKIEEENPEAKFDGGFRVLKCDISNMKEVYYNPAEYEPSLFTRLEDNIKEDRTPEDLLFQVMLDLGVLLSSKIEETTIAEKRVFNVEDNYLIACFDDNVTEEAITEIAKQKPYYFVMRDSSMANDSVATNFEQIFAAYSPDTVRKVL